jgi:hypothetical protein
LQLGSDTVLIGEEATSRVVTATPELVGRAAYQSTNRLVMVEGVRLVSALASVVADTPLTVELETSAARWSMDIAPHAIAAISVSVPRTVAAVDGPTGLRWMMSADGRVVQLQLAAAAVPTRILIAF